MGCLWSKAITDRLRCLNIKTQRTEDALRSAISASRSGISEASLGSSINLGGMRFCSSVGDQSKTLRMFRWGLVRDKADLLGRQKVFVMVDLRNEWWMLIDLCYADHDAPKSGTNIDGDVLAFVGPKCGSVGICFADDAANWRYSYVLGYLNCKFSLEMKLSTKSQELFFNTARQSLWQPCLWKF